MVFARYIDIGYDDEVAIKWSAGAGSVRINKMIVEDILIYCVVCKITRMQSGLFLSKVLNFLFKKKKTV